MHPRYLSTSCFVWQDTRPLQQGDASKASLRPRPKKGHLLPAVIIRIPVWYLRLLCAPAPAFVHMFSICPGIAPPASWDAWFYILHSSTVKVRRLLNDGVDVNQISRGHKDTGATALHLAAAGGHVEVMDELLERGCNIDARTRVGCGWTPLHHAAKERNKKAIRFLVENGAFLPPDILDERFNPPLHYCGALEWAYKVKKRSAEKESSSEKSSEEEGGVSI